MNKRSDSIKPVLNVAEQAESKAAQQYALHKDNHDSALAKRDELKQYFADYNKRANASNGQTVSPSQMQDNRAFLSRLSEIIRIQNSVVDQQGQRLENAKAQWLSCRQQSQSLDQLSNRYKSEERQHAERIEQRRSDEQSSVSHSWLRRHTAETL